MTAQDIECANLSTPLLKKQVFNADSIEKIVGWAVSHHLMTETSNPTTNNTTDIQPPATPITPPPTATMSDSPSTETTTTATTTIPTERLVITLKSIEYAVEMLTSHDPDNKAVVRVIQR